MKYALIYADGMTPVAMLQANLGNEEIFSSLASAKTGFRETIDVTLRSGIATADGGPWAQVCPLSSWDGITYTDPGYQLTVGPRGGIRQESY